MTKRKRYKPPPGLDEYGPEVALPIAYSIELAAEICTRMSLGQSLKAICKAPDMPAYRTVYDWLVLHSEFASMYTRAQQLRAEAEADELTEVANSLDGCKDLTNEQVNLLRVKIDTVKWKASRLLAQRYGDKLEVSGTAAPGALAVDGPLDLIEIGRRVAFTLALAEKAQGHDYAYRASGSPAEPAPAEPAPAPVPERLRLPAPPPEPVHTIKPEAAVQHPGHADYIRAQELAERMGKGTFDLDAIDSRTGEDTNDYALDRSLQREASEQMGVDAHRTRRVMVNGEPKYIRTSGRPKMTPSSRRPMTRGGG